MSSDAVLVPRLTDEALFTEELIVGLYIVRRVVPYVLQIARIADYRSARDGAFRSVVSYFGCPAWGLCRRYAFHAREP